MPSSFRKERDDARKGRTRAALLLAGAAVFTRQGFHKTHISDIVAEAGVGQGTFYRNFTDKRQVFEELMEDFGHRLLSEFNFTSAKLPTNAEEYRVDSILALKRAARTVDENRDIARLLLREAPTIDEEFCQKVDKLTGAFAELARFYLDHAIVKGFARPCNTQVVAEALIGVGLRILESHWNSRFGEQSLDAVIEEAVDFAFKGFGPISPNP